jgi:hypothetical protein
MIFHLKGSQIHFCKTVKTVLFIQAQCTLFREQIPLEIHGQGKVILPY